MLEILLKIPDIRQAIHNALVWYSDFTGVDLAKAIFPSFRPVLAEELSSSTPATKQQLLNELSAGNRPLPTSADEQSDLLDVINDTYAGLLQRSNPELSSPADPAVITAIRNFSLKVLSQPTIKSQAELALKAVALLSPTLESADLTTANKLVQLSSALLQSDPTSQVASDITKLTIQLPTKLLATGDVQQLALRHFQEVASGSNPWLELLATRSQDRFIKTATQIISDWSLRVSAGIKDGISTAAIAFGGSIVATMINLGVLESGGAAVIVGLAGAIGSAKFLKEALGRLLARPPTPDQLSQQVQVGMIADQFYQRCLESYAPEDHKKIPELLRLIRAG